MIFLRQNKGEVWGDEVKYVGPSEGNTSWDEEQEYIEVLTLTADEEIHRLCFYVNHSETNNMVSNVGINVGINIKSSTRRMKFDVVKGRNNSGADKVANKVANKQ